MTLAEIRALWTQALSDLLNTTLDDDVIEVLSLQTIDSIRRISIYDTYAEKAKKAEALELPYYDTYNPFTLSQRDSLNLSSKVWYIYLATYFGKSNKSKWKLFNNAAFRNDKSLIELSYILENREEYYDYLKSFDFFAEANYSNHRKFTKKSMDGKLGVLSSIDFFLDNISQFTFSPDSAEFDLAYKRAMSIPTFARMSAFDFTSSLCKCGLNVDDPISMYHESSTGPLRALKDLLELSGQDGPSKASQIEFGNNLLDWFIGNSDIKVVAQVVEDAICNWQKSPNQYERYYG